MADQTQDREKDCCARCRWADFKAQPYGAIEHTCERHQKPLASSLLAKRRCAEYEPGKVQ